MKARKVSEPAAASAQHKGVVLKEVVAIADERQKSVDQAPEFYNVKIPVDEDNDVEPDVEGIKLNE
jgi:hypothetical protein